MLKHLRQRVKKIPGVGPFLRGLYLTAFHHEGEDFKIRGGVLEGMTFRRFMNDFNWEYVNGDYEPELQEVFISLLRPGAVVYDVGANAGFMTLLASKLVGPTGTVISFEPSPTTARHLRTQVAINHLTNVIIEECAVSDKIGTSEFVAESFSVISRLAATAGNDGKSKATNTVRTITLDDVISRQKPPILVKIDIEGAELMALRGASRLLREFRPTLVVELHSEELSREFHELMKHFGYDVLLPDGQIAEPGNFSRFVVAKPARG